MAVNSPRFLAEYKDIYSGFLDRARSLIVDGYWHLKENRSKFSLKEEDFKHVQNTTENVLEALEILIDTAEGEREKPGVQPYINEILSIINVHLDRITKYYPKNKPKGFKTRDHQREEGKFQQLVFKGEQKIKAKIKTLNIENNMDSFQISFFNDEIATLPMKDVLCKLIPEVAAKVESLDIDWDLVMDNGMYINMDKKDIPDYNSSKHFWDQDLETLQFYVSEWNKIKNGITIDGYYIHGWLYDHLNYFKTPIGNQGDEIINPPLRDNEWYWHEILKDAEKRAKNLEDAGVFIFGTRRFSKALRDDAKLFYKDREGTIGEAKVGDEIYGSDGKLTMIVDVSPQGKKKLYKINFQDGRSSLACEDHLWTVFSRHSKTWKTVSTRELLSNKLTYRRKYKNRKDCIVYNYYIPITKPLEYEEKVLDIDPYLLGLWLGDGHSETTRFTTIDKEISDYIQNYANQNNFNFRKTQIKDNSDLFDIAISTEPNKPNLLLDKLRDKNLQYNKHIPREYYRASLNQRLSLLQGIMDTDGTISKGGAISISLANEILANDVLELSRSLGIHSTIKKETGKYLKNNGKLNEYWRVVMFTSLPVFRLKRKVNRIDTNPNSTRQNRKERVAITDIEYHSTDYATCIMVTNDKSEFVTTDYVVTHNSTCEASMVYYKLKTNPAKNGTLTATNSEDLASITDKINTALEYCHPAFYINMNSKDWEKIVKFGIKSKSGREFKLFYLNIINTDSGSKRGGQKTAGGAPVVFVMDEAGKEDFLKSYNAAIPSFETNDGWKCIPFYVGTGGETDLSAEAEKVLSDPKVYRFIEMDWDLLEWKVPKEAITWNRRKFGWFIPAQMGYKKGFKRIQKKFSDFLDIDSEELSKITILQTDWINNTRVCKEDRERVKSDKVQHQQEVVFYPLDPEECFMSAKKNPFPAQKIKIHKQRLQSEGDRIHGNARKIGLSRDLETGKISMYLDSDREVNEYPHDGSFVDCPFLLYDDFPKERPRDPYRFVAGLDDYKQDESDPSKQGSIGAFYIFDRLKRKIVLGLATRPDPHTEFHRQMHMALDAWNCKCFMENEDMDFKKYLDRLTLATPDMYLYTGFDAYDDFSKFSNGKRKFGWRPDKNTVPIIRGYSVDYTTDDVDFEDEEGNVTHTISGYERIEDIQLLTEMEKFKPDGNFDRLVAFGSCLAIDYYLTCKYITPMSVSKEEEINNKPSNPFKKKTGGFFSRSRRSPFSK